jgi:hypothetical protein
MSICIFCSCFFLPDFPDSCDIIVWIFTETKEEGQYRCISIHSVFLMRTEI